MANILAAAAGNWSDTATWIGGVVPGPGDNAYTNTRAITIDVDVTCDLISNRADNGATIGGTIVVTSDRLITANLESGGVTLFTLNTAGLNVEVVGNLTSGSGASTRAINVTGNSTLTVTGSLFMGTATNTSALGITSATTAVVNIIGDQTGGSIGAPLINNATTSTVNITGNVTGGSVNAATGVTVSTGVGNITGNVTGGSSGTTSFGAQCSGTGSITVTGTATGGPGGAAGLQNNSTGTVTAKRAVGNGFGIGSSATAAATGLVNINASGIAFFEELEFGERGQVPISGTNCYMVDSLTNAFVGRLASMGAAKTLSDPNNTSGLVPVEADVRFGVVYAGTVNTGTLAVPPPSGVAAGVPTDNTLGTAVLTVPTLASVVGQLLADALSE